MVVCTAGGKYVTSRTVVKTHLGAAGGDGQDRLGSA